MAKEIVPGFDDGRGNSWGQAGQAAGNQNSGRVARQEKPPGFSKHWEMNWYYVEAGKQAGPVDDPQLEQLRQLGTIQMDTLVWHEGMGDWRPFRDMMADVVPAPPPQVAAPPVALPTGSVVCVECGQVFDLNDTIPYGTVRVCAGCKPVFMQKLSEGVKVEAGVIRYAGFLIRFGAKLIDGLLLRLIIFPLSFLLGAMIGSMRPDSLSTVTLASVLGGLLGFTILMGYSVFFIGKFGATPGKMACKIKVISADGAPLSYRRAFGRFWGEVLSGCPTLFIGYLIAGFDEQRRALHDRLCNTRVIYK